MSERADKTSAAATTAHSVTIASVNALLDGTVKFIVCNREIQAPYYDGDCLLVFNDSKDARRYIKENSGTNGSLEVASITKESIIPFLNAMHKYAGFKTLCYNMYSDEMLETSIGDIIKDFPVKASESEYPTNPDFVRTASLLTQEVLGTTKRTEAERLIRIAELEVELEKKLMETEMIVPFRASAEPDGITVSDGKMAAIAIDIPTMCRNTESGKIEEATPIFTDERAFREAFRGEEWHGFNIPAKKLEKLGTDTDMFIINCATLQLPMSKTLLASAIKRFGGK